MLHHIYCLNTVQRVQFTVASHDNATTNLLPSIDTYNTRLRMIWYFK